MKVLSYVFYIFILTSLWACNKNQPPFWDEIQNFKKADEKQFPPEGCILFVGSSILRKWTNLEQVFEPYQAINRGFGGSTLLDVYRYSDDIIFPYKPRQIIIYCGDNDIVTDTVNAQMVLSRFRQIFENIRHKMPKVPIAYIAIKSSPARLKYLDIQIESNLLIKRYLESKDNTQFINVFPLLLDAQGHANADLFVEDMLHLNQRGYDILEKAIKPYLIKR